jgi:uncharacterized protein YqeY
MREAMRAELKEAMRARDTGTRDALRTALAAIENAEAVPATPGVTEAARRELSDAEVAGIVAEEIDRLDDAAAELESLGREDRADELRRQAGVLRRYV